MLLLLYSVRLVFVGVVHALIFVTVVGVVLVGAIIKLEI